nr:universal stress protein [Streptomyces europaeiscabiei]
MAHPSLQGRGGRTALRPHAVAGTVSRHRGGETHTVPAAPADVLLEATREAAVVVTGARHRTTVLGARLGAVAHTLLHRAHRPVVVVPNA